MSLENSGHKTIIIIVTFNAMPWIKKCLDSCGEYPVIVIDNASTDGTPEQLDKEYPKVTLFRQTKNLGFGQANNKGMATALELGADAVFLLNQDAYLQAGCIEKLIEAHKSHPDYGILSPVHLNGSGDSLDVKFSNYVSPQNSTNFYSDFILKKPLQAIYEVPFINAAGWFMSRAVLEAVGGFDPIFFHYGEDDNYCQRVHFHGFKIGVVPGTYLQHDRDGREAVAVAKYSQAYFQKKRVFFLNKMADLTNSDYRGWFFDQVALRKKKNLLYGFRMDFKVVKQQRKELKLLEQCFEEAVASRKINSSTGSHYL